MLVEVAPLAGAWIEIVASPSLADLGDLGRSPCGSVD